MSDHPPSIPEDLPTPVPSAPPSSRRSALVGAVLGMTALAGTIVGVGAIAGAQDDPAETEPAAETREPAAADGEDADHGADSLLSDADFAAFEECMADQLGDLWISPEIDDVEFDEDDIMDFAEGEGGELFFEGDVDDFPEPTAEEIAQWEAEEQQFIAAEEACHDLLPDEVKAEIEAWRPYEECVDGQVGDLADPWVDGNEPTEADWEAFDAAWQAADEACRDLLPADVQAELAAWDAFDQCLQDAGVFDDRAFDDSAFDDSAFDGDVHIETGDGFSIAQFGDVEGSVTVSGTAGNLEIVTSGGVTVLDEADLDAQWEAFDAAHQACEDQLPEDLKDDVFFEDEFFEGEFFEDEDGDDD